MTDQTHLQKALNSSGMSRRAFMSRAATFGVTASVASSFWTRAQATTPVRGGHMVAALVGGSTTDTMDQQSWVDTYMISVGRATRDSLVEVGQDNTAQPALAESWEARPDARTWYFKLRKGVEFSNGKTMTAEDVVASINVHRGEDSNSGAKGVFAPIEDVSIDGDYVVVALESANADFPYLLTDYHMNVVPAVDGKPDLQSGIGTGLYKVVEFEPGVRTLLERHPNAWQTDDFGFVDSAEILAVADPNARQTAVLTGQAHVINRPDLKTMGLLRRQQSLAVIDVASNAFYSHPMIVDAAPFSNADFRRAIKYGVNRQEFIDKIAFGYGSIGNDHPIGPGFRYHATDIPQIKHDPDQARHYLKKSGFEGAKIDFHASDTGYSGSVDWGILMREMLAPVGIDLNVVREPNDGYWSDVWRVKPFTAGNWGARPVEDMILSIAFTSDAEWNETHWSAPRIDELVKAARAELDEKKRSEMYREVQMLISQDGATLIPCHIRDVAVVSDKIGTTGQYGGGWELDGAHFIKRWWLNA